MTESVMFDGIGAEDRKAKLAAVARRAWTSEQIRAALDECGWSGSALIRIRNIGNVSRATSEAEMDQRVGNCKTVKKWLADKLTIDPRHQEWWERVLEVVRQGPKLFEGPPGTMTPQNFRALVRMFQWDPIVWLSGCRQECWRHLTPFGQVLGVPQAWTYAIDLGLKPVPLRLQEALLSVTDGVRQGSSGDFHIDLDWERRIDAILKQGSRLLEGPPGTMSCEALLDVLECIGWQASAEPEGLDGRGEAADLGWAGRWTGRQVLLAQVLRAPQERIDALALGLLPIPLRLQEALESLVCDAGEPDQDG